MTPGAAGGGSPTIFDRAEEPVATPSAGAGLDPEGDFDGDGLANADETDLYGTDPTKADTDGDRFSDGGEVVSGRDPLDPSDG
jgi:hypothetical protein